MSKIKITAISKTLECEQTFDSQDEKSVEFIEVLKRHHEDVRFYRPKVMVKQTRNYTVMGKVGNDLLTIKIEHL